MNTATIIAIISGIGAAIVAYVVGRRINATADNNTELDTQKEHINALNRTIAERDHKIDTLIEEVKRLTAERDVAQTKATAAEEQVERLRRESREALEAQQANLKEAYEKQLAQLNRLIEEQREANKRQVEDQMALIREQMVATSERVLKARQEELGERNVEQMSKIVDPITLSLKHMREALDNSQKEHNEAMTRLDATIEANMKNSRNLGETADRLTRALTGEVKVQGNFGELKLRQLLEDLGLKEGEQYTTQQALKDKFGARIKSDDDKRLIPDFILHFPDNRDVIVDSKVNITHYELYVNAEDETSRSQLLKEHIASVRRQVDILAKKDYSSFLDAGFTRLNFVIMYMFHEGALNLALMNDNGLWKYAYDKGVLIMGPQTMYMNLRVLELMWRQSRQLHYQQAIIETAEEMIKRVQVFAERFKAVEDGLDATRRTFDELKRSTASSGQSMITSARQIIAYGIKENKKKRSINSVFPEEEAPSLIDKEHEKEGAEEVADAIV
ncbi:MAG: DNA recombination protein RmuC [Alistipes sp.]|nr:DNA recombination protein RmuC [Alistipes sp.]